MPGFLTRTSYRRTWVEYQQQLVEKLNDETRDSEFEDRTALELHKILSRQPASAYVYNVAAMAAFNHFWWDSLAPQKTEPAEQLVKNIEEWFGSLAELRMEMLEHGEAIFGNGFVWLMQHKTGQGNTNGRMRILCTYNCGSPYKEAWKVRQPMDMATRYDPASPDALQARASQTGRIQQNLYAQMNRKSFDSDEQLDADPLLCLNVWQHMYVPDYGLTEEGKRAYLAAWWERINWDKVAQRAQAIGNRRAMPGFGGPRW